MGKSLQSSRQVLALCRLRLRHTAAPSCPCSRPVWPPACSRKGQRSYPGGPDHFSGRGGLMTENKRLIEVDFPLEQESLDSVHEKNVRHGHISTLHIWPARRPLAASRSALIATLLPDPGNEEERKMIMEKLAGHIVEHVKKKKSADGRLEDQT